MGSTDRDYLCLSMFSKDEVKRNVKVVEIEETASAIFKNLC